MTGVAAHAARRTVGVDGMGPGHWNSADPPLPSTGEVARRAGEGRWLLLGILLAPLASGLGETVRTDVTVTATVLPHARIEQAATETVLVDPLAVTRGYVDVTRQYRLRTNAPDRVLVHVHPRLGFTQAIDVSAFGATSRLVDTSLEFAPAGIGPFEVSYRLWLVPGVAPGTYPLPVQVAASIR